MGALSGLGACTTVDLSQVTATQQQRAQQAPKANIVEMASTQLTQTFNKNGWTLAATQPRAQTAASVLLKGLQGTSPQEPVVSIVPLEKFAANINLATQKVDDTYKAASLYLDYVNEHADVSLELDVLETALLNAKAAEHNFAEQAEHAEDDQALELLSQYQNSLGKLRSITDKYGSRTRAAIASNQATISNQT